MEGSWSLTFTPQFWILVGFHVFVFIMIALDLGLLSRQTAHAVSIKQAAIWSAVWIGFSLLFALGIWKGWHLWHPGHHDEGGQKAIEFLTGYIVEKSLS